MRTLDPRQTVVVGIFLTLALGVLVALIAASGTLREALRDRLELHAAFDQVNGLGPGDGVRLSGVKVGTVKRIAFDDKGAVRVDLAVDSEAAEHLRLDAVASISTDGLIGNPIVVLDPGRRSGRPLRDGDAIRAEATTSASELLESLQATNDNLLAITNDVKQITSSVVNEEGTVGRLLLDDALFDDAAATIQGLREASVAISAFAEALDTEGNLPYELVHDRTSYGAFTDSLDGMRRTATEAASVVEALEGSLSRADTPVGVLLGDTEAGADLRTTLRRLERGSALLNEDLIAIRQNFLFRRYFRKQEREEQKNDD